MTRPDHVAALATAAGAGLLTFMVTWLVGARIAERIWAPPAGPVAAIGVAIVAGMVLGFGLARRLVRTERERATCRQDHPG